MAFHVLEYLLDTAARFPDKVCYAEPAGTISFREALDRVNRVGTRLLSHQVLRKPVAVMMERSAACMLAQQGVLAAGGFYVPMDPQMPPERMRLILDQIHPEVVIVDAAFRETAEKLSCPVVLTYEDALHTPPQEEALLHIRKSMISEDLAYVLFTSGSTGIPKGVAATHRALMNYLDWTCAALGINETTVFGNAAPGYFVLSFLDLYGALKTGATTHILPKKCFLFPKLMLAYLNEHQIDTIFWAPTALMQIADSGILEKEQPRYLKNILFAGEVMRVHQLNLWRAALPEATFYNFYGATETTGLTLYYPVNRPFSEGESLPAGKPCANNRAFLLDEEGNAVAEGQAGELCVAGASLASGYYGEPEKTAAVFTLNPLCPMYPERIYHTGDLMRLNSFGEFVYAGRKDAMVKHMGYRVELGEIENAVAALPPIRSVCCLHEAQRDLLLCAYVGDISERDLLKALRDRLPAYMVPNKVLPLDALPLTPSGKTDRQKLKTLFFS